MLPLDFTRMHHLESCVEPSPRLPIRLPDDRPVPPFCPSLDTAPNFTLCLLVTYMILCPQKHFKLVYNRNRPISIFHKFIFSQRVMRHLHHTTALATS